MLRETAASTTKLVTSCILGAALLANGVAHHASADDPDPSDSPAREAPARVEAAAHRSERYRNLKIVRSRPRQFVEAIDVIEHPPGRSIFDPNWDPFLPPQSNSSYQLRRIADEYPDPSALPTEEEIWKRIPERRIFKSPCFEITDSNVRILTERIGATIGPSTVDTKAGPCRLVHGRFKCTVYFDEWCSIAHLVSVGWVDRRVEVVYLNHDYLEPCADMKDDTR